MTTVLERDPGTRAKRGRVRRLRRRLLGGVTVLAVGAGLSLGVERVLLSGPAPPDAPVIGDAADGEQFTTLVVTTMYEDPSQQADGLTLFGIDRDGSDPVVMFVPVDTIAEVPGQGSVAIGKAMSFGRLSLVEVAAENLLGITVDRVVGLDDVTLGSLIDALDGIEVTVDEEIYETDATGRRQRVFPTGRQRMDGAAAVTYLTYRAEGASDLERFPRAQKVWTAIMAAAEPARLGTAVRGLGDAVTGLDGAQGFAELLERFAQSPERVFEVMPPRPVGSGGPDELFQVDEEALRQVIQRSFAGSLPPPGPGVGARVEIRNGNGEPEVGERVAALLVPAGMRVVVSANARSFDVASTRIVIYSDDAEARAIADRVRALLGAGQIEIGTRGQTVADVTVVVGHDFLEQGS